MEININRWKKAQKAEAAAWKMSSKPKQLTVSVRSENLKHMCEYTSLSEDELKRMRILEIGGPVVERAFDDANISPKLILDPLFPFARHVGRQDKSCHRVRGVGEYLPLPDKSIDLCWCANTIDHAFSPIALLREIWRVLDNNGILIISCHVFPAWTKPFFSLLSLDPAHPHHFTLAGFRTLLKRQFEIQKELEINSIFRLSLSHNLKKNTAAVLRMRYIYFRCIPIRNWQAADLS